MAVSAAKSLRDYLAAQGSGDLDEGRVVAVFEQRDDDLAPLGIDAIHLDVEVEVAPDGRIRRFTARPTSESIAALTAARDAGRSSEGVRLAERAGTLPPAPTS